MATEKYLNKYRIASARLQNWDYRSRGAYFITICTANREHYFGEIENGKMKLSSLGVIADIFWHEIPARKPFIKLGEYVIMPNHIHGILIVGEPPKNSVAVNADGNSKIGGVSLIDDWLNNELSGNGSLNDKSLGIVEMLHATSLQSPTGPIPTTQPKSTPHKNETMSKKSPKPNSISTIIRSYKSAVTKHANRLGIANGWQTRSHDHIIRDDASYGRISKYIKNNPANWQDDRFYKNR